MNDEIELTKCSKCNGDGNKVGYEKLSKGGYLHCYYTCTKCYGKKKLDWIEQIVGVKTPVIIWGQKTLRQMREDIADER